MTQSWPMEHILKSANVDEGRSDLGKPLISCYSAFQCLALNLDVMVEDREALLQPLNSKDNKHTLRKAEWKN